MIRAHAYWRPGEPDCPGDIKAANGELHTLRCKLCGRDDPSDVMCAAVPWPRELVDAMATAYESERARQEWDAGPWGERTPKYTEAIAASMRAALGALDRAQGRS